MSGPFDRPEDPDEVTLWAGGLRAWPPAPVEPDGAVDDATVPLRGPADADSLREGRDPDDATMTGSRRREPPSGDPVPADPGVDDTTPGRRAASRAATADPIDPIDGSTIPGGRPRPSSSLSPERDAAERADILAHTDSTTASRRAQAVARPAAPQTVDARSSRAPRIPAGEPAPTYAPRVDEVARVPRTAPPSRDDGQDAASVRRRSARRGRRQALLLAGAIVLVIAAGICALVVLVG